MYKLWRYFLGSFHPPHKGCLKSSEPIFDRLHWWSCLYCTAGSLAQDISATPCMSMHIAKHWLTHVRWATGKLGTILFCYSWRSNELHLLLWIQLQPFNGNSTYLSPWLRSWFISGKTVAHCREPMNGHKKHMPVLIYQDFSPIPIS